MARCGQCSSLSFNAKIILFYFEKISSHGLPCAIQRQYEGYLTFYCLIQGHIMDHIVISYSSYSHTHIYRIIGRL